MICIRKVTHVRLDPDTAYLIKFHYSPLQVADLYKIIIDFDTNTHYFLVLNGLTMQLSKILLQCRSMRVIGTHREVVSTMMIVPRLACMPHHVYKIYIYPLEC